MPSPTFWTAEEKIPIAQKKVSIQAENGLEYALGQQVDFTIPAQTGYMMPSETYLRMDCKIQFPSGADAAGKRTRLMLDEQLGGNVLIRDIRVSSGGAQNILLEELQNVNVLTALKYDYETNDTLKKKRALTEGTTLPQTPLCRGTNGTNANATMNTDDNPWSQNTKVFNNDDYETVKCLLRLPTGIFQNDKIFPLQLTEGLRVSIILEDANKVFRQLDSVSKYRNVSCNPKFHSLNGSNTAPTDWVDNDTWGRFWLQRINSQGVDTGVLAVPFIVGEKIGFFNPTTGEDTADKLDFTISAIEWDNSVGSANDDGGLVKISCDPSVKLDGSGFDISQDFYVYSRTLEDETTYTPTCSVNNVELIVQQVEMPAGYTAKMNSMLKAGGSMNYDFLSYTNYKYSQQSSDIVANIRLPIGNSRCKSILCIPCDASNYTPIQAIKGDTTYVYDKLLADCVNATNSQNTSKRSGLVGIADHASNYQFIYDGKLNPNRKVPLSRISVVGENAPINQQCLIEQEKALHQAGIDPLSFEAYKKNFFIGRALSLQNGVYDARGKDFNLQVEYQESTAPTKGKLWNCWVAHLRRIVVRGDQIALEV